MKCLDISPLSQMMTMMMFVIFVCHRCNHYCVEYAVKNLIWIWITCGESAIPWLKFVFHKQCCVIMLFTQYFQVLDADFNDLSVSSINVIFFSLQIILVITVNNTRCNLFFIASFHCHTVVATIVSHVRFTCQISHVKRCGLIWQNLVSIDDPSVSDVIGFYDSNHLTHMHTCINVH